MVEKRVLASFQAPRKPHYLVGVDAAQEADALRCMHHVLHPADGVKIWMKDGEPDDAQMTFAGDTAAEARLVRGGDALRLREVAMRLGCRAALRLRRACACSRACACCCGSSKGREHAGGPLPRRARRASQARKRERPTRSRARASRAAGGSWLALETLPPSGWRRRGRRSQRRRRRRRTCARAAAGGAGA
jgi:hypothetical protein